MEQPRLIGSVLRTSTTPSLSVTSGQSSLVTACKSEYGDGVRFLTTYNADMQRQVSADVRRCFTGNAPTLRTVSLAFGLRTAETFCALQLKDLAEYAGVKDKFTMAQIDRAAVVIVNRYGFLKATELMYFFHLFKAGEYGRFYGAADNLTVMAGLREFVKLRDGKLTQYENEARADKAAREREGAVSWEEYCKLRGIADRPSHLSTSNEKTTI